MRNRDLKRPTLQPLNAQAVANAEIHGVISDPGGAVAAAAQIKATQTGNGGARTAVSNADGCYVLPNLPVGPYSLEVLSPSFGSCVQSGNILQVGNSVQVNVSLQLKAVTQQPQISANAAIVETKETSISEVVDQRRLLIFRSTDGRRRTRLFYPAARPCRRTRRGLRKCLSHVFDED